MLLLRRLPHSCKPCCSLHTPFRPIGSDGSLIYNYCSAVLLSCRGLSSQLPVGTRFCSLLPGTGFSIIRTTVHEHVVFLLGFCAIYGFNTDAKLFKAQSEVVFLDKKLGFHITSCFLITVLWLLTISAQCFAKLTVNSYISCLHYFQIK